MRVVLAACLLWSGLVVACSSGSESRDEAVVAPSDGPGASTLGSSDGGEGGASVGPPPVGPGPDATPATPNGSSAPTLPSPPSTGGIGGGGAAPGSAGAENTGGRNDDGGDGSGGTAGNSNGGSNAGTANAGNANAGSPASAGNGGIPSPGEPAIHYVGRFAQEGEAMRFEWSGSGAVAAFEGTSVAVLLEDGGSNQFTVVIDGEERPKLVAQSGTASYELASDLEPGRHTVEVYRRTEASFGTSAFMGFDFGDGTLLPAPVPVRRLELIGDSITCGYGNEGESATCPFSADTENHYATYGAIAARALDAEVVTIAWSGKGIVYNYDTDTNEPLPELYDAILPQGGDADWDFSVLPDAVVINLGTNDFSTEDDPTPELFTGRYIEFLTHLRQVYPTTYILCTVGPLLGGADLDAARLGIADAVAARQGEGDELVEVWEMNVGNDDPGCDYHPGLETHQAMADALVTELQERLGW
jgi:lysophospholipase L1-like esterase